MMTISITRLYDLISTKLGKETAENLTTFIEEKIKSEVDTKASNLATKESLADTKSEIIKWMFIFWVSQLAASVLLFLKK
jgi:hypothetical protein